MHAKKKRKFIFRSVDIFNLGNKISVTTSLGVMPISFRRDKIVLKCAMKFQPPFSVSLSIPVKRMCSHSLRSRYIQLKNPQGLACFLYANMKSLHSKLFSFLVPSLSSLAFWCETDYIPLLLHYIYLEYFLVKISLKSDLLMLIRENIPNYLLFFFLLAGILV